MVIRMKNHDFHIIDPSPIPIFTAFTIFICAISGVMYIHEYSYSGYLLIAGFLFFLTSLAIWTKNIVYESVVEKTHNSTVSYALRLATVLFIGSEIAFFCVFFCSFINSWVYPKVLPDDIWTNVIASWPPVGIEKPDTWGIPWTNTLLLLLSGTTVTWAHYAILKNKNSEAFMALLISVVLGTIFVFAQAYEYLHLPFSFVEEGAASIYSSNFYMATGFHGAHVIIGITFLTLAMIGVKNNSITSDNHVMFEFAAWYWHFVDVVWLFLFVVVYWIS